MSDQSANSCRIGFINRWSMQTHLWGVALGRNTFELDPKLFSCCGGAGLVVESVDRMEARLCGLTRRWHLLTNIFRQSGVPAEQWEGFWNQVMLKVSGGDSSAVEHELRYFVGKYLDAMLNSSKGELFSSSSPGLGSSVIGPSVVPVLAAILSWHFERVTLIARPGEVTLPINLWQDLLRKHPKSNSLILLDAAQDLWNASKLEPTEAVIAFAYERKIPIWIHFGAYNRTANTSDNVDTRSKSRSFRNSVSRRLDGLRGKSPFEWLSPQSQSRLSEICKIPIAGMPTATIPEHI